MDDDGEFCHRSGDTAHGICPELGNRYCHGLKERISMHLNRVRNAVRVRERHAAAGHSGIISQLFAFYSPIEFDARLAIAECNLRQCGSGSLLTHQNEFGGLWTQQKLEVLSKYLPAYTKIFRKNPNAQFYTTSYVDAFAGTGVLRRPALGGIAKLIPGIAEAEEEFRKGSVRRALEVKPPFDKYVLIEKNAKKCCELNALAAEFPEKQIEVIKEDANSALLKWCENLNARRDRAVVFLDPFGASVEWNVISALAKTRAVDLWILFPYFAINRMLVRNRKPQGAIANRLTKVFGTTDWEKSFYSSRGFHSLLEPGRAGKGGLQVRGPPRDYRLFPRPAA